MYIISSNVPKEVFEYIKRLETTFDIMQKLKNLNGKKKSSDLQYRTKEMYSIKAKNLSERRDVINQIEEIFDII